MAEQKMLHPYPEYKDSGVVWLGKIPAHWEMKKSSYLFVAEKGAQASLLTKEYCSTIPGRYPVFSGQTENNGIMASIGHYEFDCDSTVIFTTTVGAKAMDLRRLEGKFSLSQNCMIIKSSQKALSMDFYYYHLQPLFSYERGLIPTHMQASFRMEDLYNYRVAVPPLPEQQKIADFLDYETEQMDRLIAKQERLIELLGEKRQAVISHAVTKGLNPDAPMKDSGVEWIGEIPAHWEVKPLNTLGRCQNGINIGADFFGSGYPFISYGDVYNNKILPEQGSGLVKSSLEDRRIYSVKYGDVFFTRTSETVEEIGFSSVCLKTVENATFAGFLIRFRPNNLQIIFPHYGAYYFSNRLLRFYFVGQMNLVTRASLSQELLKKLPVILPPLAEQKEIAQFLNTELAKMDALMAKAKQQIELLKERRTALISAAVTGKIDLRHWQPRVISQSSTP